MRGSGSRDGVCTCTHARACVVVAVVVGWVWCVWGRGEGVVCLLVGDCCANLRLGSKVDNHLPREEIRTLVGAAVGNVHLWVKVTLFGIRRCEGSVRGVKQCAAVEVRAPVAE
eukprot:SAG11_NODE_610_length_8221_cov_4.801650_8_plen_113_part_00